MIYLIYFIIHIYKKLSIWLAINIIRNIKSINIYFITTSIAKVPIDFFLCHDASRPQQGRQREPSVNTLRCLFSVQFWRHYGEWRNSTPRFASKPERKNENINDSIYSSENRTHNLSRLQSHFVLLWDDWPCEIS